MARYIKANPKVAQFLHLETERNRVKDGNYILWQADMLAFGSLIYLAETLEQIGGISLTPTEARQEQDGTVTRELPVAKDERFVIVKQTEQTRVDNVIDEVDTSENITSDNSTAEGPTEETTAEESTTEETTAESEEETITTEDVGTLEDVVDNTNEEGKEE